MVLKLCEVRCNVTWLSSWEDIMNTPKTTIITCKPGSTDKCLLDDELMTHDAMMPAENKACTL